MKGIFGDDAIFDATRGDYFVFGDVRTGEEPMNVGRWYCKEDYRQYDQELKEKIIAAYKDVPDKMSKEQSKYKDPVFAAMLYYSNRSGTHPVIGVRIGMAKDQEHIKEMIRMTIRLDIGEKNLLAILPIDKENPYEFSW